MPYLDVLVHRATPMRRVLDPITGWVEGERVDTLTPGTPFDCCLFLPQGTEAGTGRGRKVTEPTLLVAPEDDFGAPVALDPDDELHIVAPELNAARGLPADTSERWMVVGAPQPFGKPGEPIIGSQATLRRVDD